MKHIVKRCKSRRWIAYVTFSAVFIVILLEFLWIIPDDTQLKSEEGFKYFLLPIVGFTGGLAIAIKLLGKIWKPALDRQKEINNLRNKHHIKLIEKSIDSGNVDKTRFLIFHYLESKYLDIRYANFFFGAYRAKFYDKLEVDEIFINK